MDMIEELRLRQWARAHYVCRPEREGNWHPVVLEEMRQMDEERTQAPVAAPAERNSADMPPMRPDGDHPSPVRSSFVPLAPTRTADDSSECSAVSPHEEPAEMPETNTVHAAHSPTERLADPNILRRIDELEQFVAEGAPSRE